jgi:hypothetical protein
MREPCAPRLFVARTDIVGYGNGDDGCMVIFKVITRKPFSAWSLNQSALYVALAREQWPGTARTEMATLNNDVSLECLLLRWRTFLLVRGSRPIPDPDSASAADPHTGRAVEGWGRQIAFGTRNERAGGFRET